MRKSFILLILLVQALGVMAQQADYSKMSSMVRQAVLENRTMMRRMPSAGQREMCAFVRVTSNADSLFSRHGCRSLRQLTQRAHDAPHKKAHRHGA